MFNLLGEPVDNRPEPEIKERWAIHRPAPSYEEQTPATEILETGIKVVDLICPYAKGGKIGLFGGAGVGKTVLIMELTFTMLPLLTEELFVFTVVGEALHVRETTFTMKCRKAEILIKRPWYTNSMNEPPGAGMRVALSGLTMAEYFRDVKNQRHIFVH